MKKRTKDGRGAKEAFGFSVLFHSVLWGILTMALTAILTMLCFSAIAYSGSDPSSLTFPLGIASLYMSIFAGGIAASKKGASMRLIAGLIYTAAAFLLFSAVKLPMMGRHGIEGSGLYMLFCLAFSALGVLFPIIISKRKKSNMKKRAEKFRRKRQRIKQMKGL